MGKDDRGITPQDYPATLSVKDGVYYFTVPGLGIVVSGKSVNAAHNSLRARLAETLDTAREGDLLDSLPLPVAGGTSGGAGQGAGPGGTLTMKSDLRGFFIKTVIVGLVAAVILGSVGITVSSGFRRAVEKADIKGGRHFWTKLEEGLYKAADAKKGLPAEKEAKIVEALSTLAHRVQPFTRALAPAFDVAPDGVAPDEKACRAICGERRQTPDSARE